MHILKSGVKAQVMFAFTGTCQKTGLFSPLEWTCGKSWITQTTWIFILMKAVWKVYNTTANSADQRMGISRSARRKVDGADVWIFNPHTFKQWWLQDQDQQRKLKAMTIFSKLHSILNEIITKPESSTSVESQVSVLNIAFHTLVILLKVSTNMKLIGIILFAVRIMYRSIIKATN